MPRYCHNQDCSDYGKAQPDKGMNWVCRTCQEDVHSRPPTKKSRLKKKDELPKRQKRDSREIKESKSEKSPNRNLKRQFSDSESSDNEETGGSNDQGKKEQEQPRRKKLRVSLARHVTNTQKQGYRMGVVTWNTHGLQKPQNVSEQDALAFEEHLRFVYQWVEKGTELKEAADLLWNRKDCLKTIKKRLKDYYAVCEDIERELNDQRHWPYLHELRARYEQLVGYRLQISDETRPKELSELKTGALSARAESLDGELREEYASFDDKLHEAIRTLLRKITCLAIVKMFELHKWLDVLVLQEVKYTGITMLIEAIGNDLFVHPGPMMSSGRGKKREIEYFPIIMRKNGKSFHHLHKLSLEKVWWVNTDGTTGKMGLNDKRYLPDGTAHMIWNKSQDTFRPVVVYDIKIGQKTGAPVVHVGVVHTTPGPRTSDLTPAEKRSIRRLTGSTRKKDISSHEFQRPHQYMQIEAAFDGVRKWAYKWDPKHPEFFGPWILAGDYYLFKESRVVDMETQYGEDQSFGSFAPEIEKELQARLAAYKACGERSDVYKVRSEMWHWRAVDWGRQTYITTHTRNHYAELLRRDDSLVVGEAIQAEPMTRSRLMLHQPRWLAPYPYYNSIDAELFADVLSWRTRMYKDLADHCAFYKGRAAALAEVEKGTIKEKFVALRKDNKVLMERVGAPGGKQAKTEVGMHISGQDDPMRNPLGMTFRGQVDEGALEFAQTISGTNLDKYEGLSKLDRDDAAERYAEFIEARARFVVRLKVADFLVHTKYDPTTNVGATHWTACTVGMLSPDLGKIVLADTADLTISRFWAAFSDHFPVGGVLSTVNREDEAGSIRNSIVREEPGAPLLVEQFELERRKRRAEMLLMLHLIRNLNPQVQDEEIDKELKAYRLKLSEMNKAELTEAIHDLEDRLKVPQVDRFDIDDTPLTATDIGWSGDLIFSFGAPVLHAMDNTEGSSSQASTNF